METPGSGADEARDASQRWYTPLTEQIRAWRWYHKGGAVAFLLIMIGTFIPHDAADVYAAISCEKAVLQQLLAPASAQFPKLIDFSIRELPGGDFLVSSHVDAHNPYGALVRRNFSCRVRVTDETSSVLNVSVE